MSGLVLALTIVAIICTIASIACFVVAGLILLRHP